MVTSVPIISSSRTAVTTPLHAAITCVPTSAAMSMPSCVRQSPSVSLYVSSSTENAATSSPTSGTTTSRGATGCAPVSLSIAGTVSSTPVASSITVRSSGGSSTGSAGFAASCGSSASGICGVSSCTGSSTCEETFSASLSVVFFGSSVQ